MSGKDQTHFRTRQNFDDNYICKWKWDVVAVIYSLETKQIQHFRKPISTEEVEQATEIKKFWKET